MANASVAQAVNRQRIAELETERTSPGCVAYRLVVTDGEGLTAPRRVVWSNRVYDRPEGHAGARKRAREFCAEHGYRMVDRAVDTGEGVATIRDLNSHMT